ncbi:threonylcarbamoyl-AMP synthase [Thermus sp. SYSU G05001]|uniref:L-threonylcarbamoyladenylate synthase n=1 Tax=Thermus brevis TaxID=2862456 RepID=A0ABS6ZXG9_9DEIN|nr:L-threonylcarbamoyladenylate synthase [Thermus brevis]MBW6394752.1 threonylcarbamoyl-AMP synthase [Thermus brevis]
MVEVYQKELQEAAETLRRGGLVAFPTDTVWGVLARMEDEAACRRIYELKGREEGKPLQVLVADLESALKLADLGKLRDKFLRLAEAFWPGGLTVVVPGQGIPPWISRDGSVGLRMPDHVLLRELLRRVGGYAAATSLNRSGEPPVRTEAEARAFAVDYVFPGEAMGLASSVVDLRTRQVLREGAIPKEALLPHLQDA